MDRSFRKSDRERLLKSEEYEFQISKEDTILIVNTLLNKDKSNKLEKYGGIIGLFEKLKVNPSSGIENKLSSIDMKTRKRVFGTNDPIIPELPSFIFYFLDVLNDKTLIFLLFISALVLITNGNQWLDFFALIVSIIIAIFVLGVTDYSKDEMIINIIQEFENKDLRVLREKKEIRIQQKNLVVGDLLIITSGDILPVDGFLIKSNSILIEYEDKHYHYSDISYRQAAYASDFNENTPLLLSGSKVLKGHGKMLVLTVGKNTKDGENKVLKFQNRKNNENYDDYLNFEKRIDDSRDQHDELPKVPRTYDSEKMMLFDGKSSLDHENEKNIGTKEIIKFNKNFRKYYINLYSNSPLLLKMEEISSFISKIGIVISILAAFLVFLENNYSGQLHYKDMFSSIPICIYYGLLVVVITLSKSIPLTITLCVNNFIEKMKAKNIIVKNINACEAMAYVNCICTDYSRILTIGEMKINSIFIEDKLFSGKDLTSLKSKITEDSICFLNEGVSINSVSYFAEQASSLNFNKNTFNDFFTEKKFFGDPVECALLSYLKENLNLNYSTFRHNPDRKIIICSDYKVGSKVSYAVISMEDKSDYFRIYIRGSHEILFFTIINYITDEGYLDSFEGEKQANMKKLIINELSDGNNPILLCYKDVLRDVFYKKREKYSKSDFEKFLNEDLTLIALVNLKESLKSNTIKAIEDLQNGGIQVKLITSHKKEKATFFANKVGILKKDESNVVRKTEKRSTKKIQTIEKLILSPHDMKKNTKEKIKSSVSLIYSDLYNLKDSRVRDSIENFRKYYENLKKSDWDHHILETKVNNLEMLSQEIDRSLVISSSKEMDKFVYTSILRQLGYIVAYLGEGVSDALSMSDANVGISMSLQNSNDICRENSDILLMDDNLESLSSLILHSKNIFDSVTKFVQYQIVSISVLCLFILITKIFSINFYLYPTHLLFISLIINTFGPLCFSEEEPEIDSISLRPYAPNKKIITRRILLNILLSFIIESLIMLIVLFEGPRIFGVESDFNRFFLNWEESNGFHCTIFFNTLVFIQIFNLYIFRSLEHEDLNIFRNLSLFSFLSVFTVFLIIIQLLILNYGGLLMKVRTISNKQFFISVVLASFSFISLIIMKYNNFYKKEDDSDRIETDAINEIMKNKTARRTKSDYGLLLI